MILEVRLYLKNKRFCIGGVKGYRSQVEQMTARSADQAASYLSQYFAKQGWIPQEKAR